MTDLASTLTVPVSDATSTLTMTIKVSGVKWFKLRTTLALWIIRLAAIVSPIVTRIEIN